MERILSLTEKNFRVEPVRLAPYWTPPLLLARSLTSSSRLVGVSMVRKAARLAVYEDTIINVKKHQMAATIRVDMALKAHILEDTEDKRERGVQWRWTESYLGATSDPCWSKAPVVNQSALFMVNWFSSTWGSWIQGYGFVHSMGDRRPSIKKQKDTPRYARPRYNQTSFENGSIKEKVVGWLFCGFRYRIAIPSIWYISRQD